MTPRKTPLKKEKLQNDQGEEGIQGTYSYNSVKAMACL
jgi:hypothetical protein